MVNKDKELKLTKKKSDFLFWREKKRKLPYSQEVSTFFGQLSWWL